MIVYQYTKQEIAMKFTDTNIKKLPLGLEHRDSATTGLVLRISPKGKYTWNFVYRYQGKLSRINIGNYPTITITEARQRVLEFRTNMADGRPPLAGSTKGISVARAYQEWVVIKRRKLKRPEVVEGIFKNHLLPDLGEYLVESITATDVIKVIESRIARGQSGTAGIALQSIKELLNHCVMLGHIVNNPIALVSSKKLGISKSKRDRVLTIDELKVIWNSDYDGLVVPMLKFIMLTFLRGGECRQLEWSMVDYNNKKLSLPASIMKAGMAHDVPLSETAISILRYQEQFRVGKYVWISGYDDKLLPRTYLPVAARYLRAHHTMSHWVPHDLRRSVSTLCDECDVPWDVADMLLAHKPSGVLGVYQRGTLWAQRVEAVNKWEDWLLKRV